MVNIDDDFRSSSDQFQIFRYDQHYHHLHSSFLILWAFLFNVKPITSISIVSKLICFAPILEQIQIWPIAIEIIVIICSECWWIVFSWNLNMLPFKSVQSELWLWLDWLQSGQRTAKDGESDKHHLQITIIMIAIMMMIIFRFNQIFVHLFAKYLCHHYKLRAKIIDMIE